MGVVVAASANLRLRATLESLRDIPELSVLVFIESASIEVLLARVGSILPSCHVRAIGPSSAPIAEALEELPRLVEGASEFLLIREGSLLERARLNAALEALEAGAVAARIAADGILPLRLEDLRQRTWLARRRRSDALRLRDGLVDELADWMGSDTVSSLLLPAAVFTGWAPLPTRELVGVKDGTLRVNDWADGKVLAPVLSSSLLDPHLSDAAFGVRLARVQPYSDAIVRELAQYPERVRGMGSSEFEEFVAELLRRHGYEVRRTPATRDGGFDLVAARHEPLGTLVWLVECKRYSTRMVDVQAVRQLYGVVEQHRATAGLLVTTSGFSAPARGFQQSVQHRMSLRDFDAIKSWLEQVAATTRLP